MKSFRRLFRGYAVALAAAVFFSASAQAVANKAIVRAIRDGGADFSTDKGKNWKKASVGTVLAANTMIRTDANATADLFLGDNGPVVRVTKATTMGIDRLDVENTGIEKVIETQLDLKNGRILGNVKKMAAASKYEVKTPVGVAGIRGTEYSISADGTVNVVSGTVVVVYIRDGQTLPPVTIQANQSTSLPGGGNVTVTSLNQSTVDGITTLLVGTTTNPNGTITTTLETPAGTAPIMVTSDGNGTLPLPGVGGIVIKTPDTGPVPITNNGGPTVTPGPPTTTGNFDTQNDLSETGRAR